MKNFEGFGLHPALGKSLAKMEYTMPTPIQAQAIPLALKGRDIMGSAQTGTGKTAAFAIPIIENLLTSPQGNSLVLTPTRELGQQIMSIMEQLLGPKSRIKTAFIIGGAPMDKQLRQLKQRPRLIVGTPGRINDHLERGTLDLSQTNFLVLDETDRMLDMGFSVQLDRIIEHIPEERQTLMFSATLPKNILSLSKKYLTNPERIAVGSTNTPSQDIEQEIIHINDADKYEELVRQLDQRSGSIIIFVKTKYGTERLAKKLAKDKFSAQAIHGDLKQNRRDRVIREFRAKKYRILVATDIAARGLDIPHIEHVINHDLPQVAEDYIHRIGRTARAGATGHALCFISPKDGRKWQAIEELINPGQNKKSRKKPTSKKASRKKELDKKTKYSRKNNTPKDSDGKNPSRKKPAPKRTESSQDETKKTPYKKKKALNNDGNKAPRRAKKANFSTKKKGTKKDGNAYTPKDKKQKNKRR